MGDRRREITAVKVATLSCLAYFHFFLHLKKHLAGQKYHEDEEVRNSHYVVVCTVGRVI
jgi:hypothetical protein